MASSVVRLPSPPLPEGWARIRSGRVVIDRRTFERRPCWVMDLDDEYMWAVGGTNLSGNVPKSRGLSEAIAAVERAYCNAYVGAAVGSSTLEVDNG